MFGRITFKLVYEQTVQKVDDKRTLVPKKIKSQQLRCKNLSKLTKAEVSIQRDTSGVRGTVTSAEVA